MIRYKETAEERIRANALEELGAEVEFSDPPIVEQIIEPERRVRGHHISLLYKCACSPLPVRRFISRVESQSAASGRGTGDAPKTDCGTQAVLQVLCLNLMLMCA
jgi:ADP-ribose pyrophosphatase YjhB (NUDIX family)